MGFNSDFKELRNAVHTANTGTHYSADSPTNESATCKTRSNCNQKKSDCL